MSKYHKYDKYFQGNDLPLDGTEMHERLNEFKKDLWTGHLHYYKGLGIFAKEDIKLERLSDNGGFQHFIPVRVNDEFNLLGVWAMKDYVEMIHDYFDANWDLFDENIVMCDDFNSNEVFNDHHPEDKNHTVLDEELQSKGLKSVYHETKREKQGEETSKTFYMARLLNKPFHLDFVYAGENMVKEFNIFRQLQVD